MHSEHLNRKQRRVETSIVLQACERQGTEGFTLVEVSIVLVIIGLIVGGILVGQDMISAAETRAAVTQIEKYNTAVNTFANKYGGLPGDLNLGDATTLGFNTTYCAGEMGGRDGNGLIDGFPTEPLVQGAGETVLFWQDLSAAQLIDGSFPNGGATSLGCATAGGAPVLTTSTLSQWYPLAKMGKANFIYVYETNNYNWFGLSAVYAQDGSGQFYSNTNLR